MSLLLSLAGVALVLLVAYALGTRAMGRKPAPFEVTLAVGAVLASLGVFVLLLFNSGHAWAFCLAGVAAFAGIVFGGRTFSKPDSCPRIGLAIFGAYGIWYAVNALAPEIMPDGITYHLGLVREYVRLAGFPDRTNFYDMVPQGMEMLYVVAYAIGKHPAAKLVEFAFFVAGLPLIFRLGKRLDLSPASSLLVAVFYFCAPVIGLTGTSSYNDAAGVFFLLAALYLLLDQRFFAAGLCAGFCYAIKMPGLQVPICAVVWLLATRRMKAAALLAVGAGLAIGPWMLRSEVLTGNPVAPLGNRVFPNPYFHIATEMDLGAGLRSLHGVRVHQIPWELAFGDRLAGTYGPLILLLPLGLLALRRREGRVLWLAALILAIPWFTNSGARFLMQSFVLATFALAMVLPQRVAWAAIALQAIFCWPHVLDRIQPVYSFRLHEFPLAAAFGIEPEADYLRRHVEEYDVARMIERATPPNSRTLALLSVANAYLDREIAVSWQSAEADTMLDTIRLAALYTKSPGYDWKASWPERDVRALRFVIPVGYDGESDINEVQILSGDTAIANSPQWTFHGHPNPWEGALPFDGNLATRWRTWEKVRPGTSFEVDFGHTQRITSVVLVTHTPTYHVPLQVWGRESSGQWRVLAENAEAVPRASQDLRLDAARALRRAGFRYILVPTGTDGNSPIGNVMVGHEAEWGMERAGEAGRFFLLRVK